MKILFEICMTHFKNKVRGEARWKTFFVTGTGGAGQALNSAIWRPNAFIKLLSMFSDKLDFQSSRYSCHFCFSVMAVVCFAKLRHVDTLAMCKCHCREVSTLDISKICKTWTALKKGCIFIWVTETAPLFNVFTIDMESKKKRGWLIPIFYTLSLQLN